MTTIVLFGVKGSGKDTVGDILMRGSGYRKEAFANPIKEMVKLAFPRFTDEDLYGSSEARERQETRYPLGERCVRCDGWLEFCDVQNLIIRDTPESLAHVCLGARTFRCLACGAEYPAFLNARIVLQVLGTEFGRRLCPDVWVDACFERIRQYQERELVGKPEHATPFVITDGRFKNELDKSKKLGAFCVKLTRGLAESTSWHPSEAEFRTILDHEFDFVLDNASIPLDQMSGAVDRMLAYALADHHVQE